MTTPGFAEVVLEHQAAGTLIVDSDTVVRYANHSAVELLGVARERLVGREFGFPLLPGDVADVNVATGEGSIRTLALRVTAVPGEAGHQLVTLFDVTGRVRRYEQEHRLVESLQRSLLLERLPAVAGVELAARYLPGDDIVRVGGDWYDVIPLDGGRVGVAIGDVAGHGIESTALMSELRNALRAYALEHPSPAVVVERLDEMIVRLEPSGMATLVYLVYDPAAGTARFAAAGHPFPLLVAPDGQARFLQDGRSLPLGTGFGESRPEGEAAMRPGSVLVLYTDGLVERRTRPLEEGLNRLAEIAGERRPSPDATCDAIVAQLLGDDPQMDDVAVLVMNVAAVTAL